MHRTVVALLVPALLTTGGLGLARDGDTPKAIVIKAGRLIDVRAGRTLTDRAILIEGERIRSVGDTGEILGSAPKDAAVIDLSHAAVLPGLIDCHTHVLLQGDITQADYDEQLLKESIPYRTIRATVAARTALMNGFTAIRGLETEGAMYADVDVKRAIEHGDGLDDESNGRRRSAHHERNREAGPTSSRPRKFDRHSPSPLLPGVTQDLGLPERRLGPNPLGTRPSRGASTPMASRAV